MCDLYDANDFSNICGTYGNFKMKAREIICLLSLTLSGCSFFQPSDDFQTRMTYSCVSMGGKGLTFLDNNYYKLAKKYPDDLPEPATNFTVDRNPSGEPNACVAHFKIFSF